MPTWELASRDNALTLNLAASDNGALNGMLTYEGKSYPVTGAWAASGSIPGRNASAFSLSGRTQDLPDVPDFIAASGIMTGSGTDPTKIDIRVGVSSSSDGTLNYYSGVLIPLRFEHIVVVMLENRGFDSILGYLYKPDDEPQRNLPPLKTGEPTFNGLAFLDTKPLANQQGNIVQEPVPTVRASNTPGWDPGEEFEHVNMQLFGSKVAPPSLSPANMLGFLADYADHAKGDDEALKQIMHCYTPADLPVLSQLAKGYAVSDMWFASVPTQTNANRAYSICGTSLGLVDNGYYSARFVPDALADDRFEADTVWNVLHNNGNDDWAIFWQDGYPTSVNDPYTRKVFPHLENIPDIGSHFFKTDDSSNGFFAKAEAGTLPAFSYIEPAWGGALLGNKLSIMGNEYHPPSDTTSGEAWIKKIYQSLISNQSAWEKTLFLIVFDEHGGTYDHEPPPWGATPPWGNGPVPPDLPKGLQYPFQFDRFGVRAPAIVISPYVEKATVFRSPLVFADGTTNPRSNNTPFDHTSIIATVLKNLLPQVPYSKWGMGERVANAPTFDAVLTRTEPRTDNVFTSVSPTLGTPLNYGDAFYLRHKDGGHVSSAYTQIIGYYFPTLSDTAPVTLRFRFGWGEVTHGALVQLRTDEYLAPETNTEPLVFAGVRNTLGTWKDQHDCYYWHTDDTVNYGQQYWQVKHVDGTAGSILYGDEVYLESTFPDYLGQRLKKDVSLIGRLYLSTATGAEDYWTIEPAASESDGN